MGLLTALFNRIADANSDSRYQQLLNSLVMVEADATPGGILGEYKINANTNAADAVDAIDDGTPLMELRDQYLAIPEIEQVLISLPRLHELFVKPLSSRIATLLGDRLLTNRRVKRIVGQKGSYQSYDVSGRLIAGSRNLVMCCGGTEVLLAELKPWQDKTVFGGEFLRLSDSSSLPKDPGPIVITSASHSGFSCVWRMLHDPLLIDFARGRDIVILQRRPIVKLRCDHEFARRHRLVWDEENDVCPRTGLIYASGGLRKDAKFLYLAIRDGEEKRARIEPIKQLADVSQLLDAAALVIQCAGFVPVLPEIEVNGKLRRIEQYSKAGEVTDADSHEVIPGLFACGLGMQILPDDFHGEKSFDGSINGLQSYPLAIAPGIIEQIINNEAII